MDVFMAGLSERRLCPGVKSASLDYWGLTYLEVSRRARFEFRQCGDLENLNTGYSEASWSILWISKILLLINCQSFAHALGIVMTLQ